MFICLEEIDDKLFFVKERYFIIMPQVHSYCQQLSSRFFLFSGEESTLPKK